MRTAIMAAVLLAGCTAAAENHAAAAADTPIPTALAGRDLGPAVNCLTRRDIESARGVTPTAVLFRLRNGKVYRSDLPTSCPAWTRRGVAYAHSSPVSQLCAGEPVTLFEPAANFTYGPCIVGRFTPFAPAQQTR